MEFESSEEVILVSSVNNNNPNFPHLQESVPAQHLIPISGVRCKN